LRSPEGRERQAIASRFKIERKIPLELLLVARKLRRQGGCDQTVRARREQERLEDGLRHPFARDDRREEIGIVEAHPFEAARRNRLRLVELLRVEHLDVAAREVDPGPSLEAAAEI